MLATGLGEGIDVGVATGTGLGAEVGSANASSIVDVTNELSMGRNYPIVSSEEDLGSLFDRFTQGGKVLEDVGSRLRIGLPDGTSVQWRVESEAGGPAIDIVLPDGEIVKVHVS